MICAVFNKTFLSQDLKRLYATGYFADISVDVLDHESGKKVIFTVKEKPVLQEIILKGNKALKKRQTMERVCRRSSHTKGNRKGCQL